MIFTRPVRRKVAAVGPISGKPTVAFSPNTGHPYYPNDNAHFFTNLIAGQTAYVDDSIAGKADFSYTTGAFGNHSLGEGFEVVVNSASDGGEIDYNNNNFQSVAVLVECAMTDSGSSFAYLLGNNTGNSHVFGPVNIFSCPRPQGIYRVDASSNLCLPQLTDGQLHRICMKYYRDANTSNSRVKVAVDGVMAADIQRDIWFTSNTYYIGRNGNGAGETLMATGAWIWGAPQKTTDPLPDSAMLDLTVDPWPYLVTLD